jgi:hypothetical protein
MFGFGGFQTAFVLAGYTGYGLPSIANVRVQMRGCFFSFTSGTSRRTSAFRSWTVAR